MTASPDPEPAPIRPDWTPEPLSDGGWGLFWRGRRLKTPERTPLTLTTHALAALTAEPSAGPFSAAQRLAFTAVDRVAPAREATAAAVARFAGSDVLCYFAEGSEALAALEEALWSPWLAWAGTELGLDLVRTRGIAHAAQPPGTLERAHALALELDDFQLTAVAAAASLFGSAVLAFAVERGALSGEAAFGLSRLDEAFQEERWGVDEEAAKRTAALAEEARLLDRWLRACKAG